MPLSGGTPAKLIHCFIWVQGDLCVGIYTNATMHTPLEVTRDALKVANDLAVDCVVRSAGLPTVYQPVGLLEEDCALTLTCR